MKIINIRRQEELEVSDRGTGDVESGREGFRWNKSVEIGGRYKWRRENRGERSDHDIK